MYPPPAVDSTSDNDTNEKLAREKFKKTSLASLTKHAVSSTATPEGEAKRTTTKPNELARASSHAADNKEDPRGRPVVKRALEDEDIDLSARENTVALERIPDSNNAHARKRSRDVRAGIHMKDDGRLYDNRREPVQEEVEGIEPEDNRGLTLEEQSKDSLITGTDDFNAEGIPAHFKSEEGSALPDADVETQVEGAQSVKTPGIEEKRKAEDEEMKDGTYSPRKKRSRDHMDTEAHREQKIAATEETRAQRRSDELDRADMSSHSGPASLQNGPEPGTAALSTTGLEREHNAAAKKSEPPKATFGATNMLRPLSRPSRSKSPTNTVGNISDGIEGNQATAPSAFASSGFASFASSSDSPFNAAATSVKPAAPSPSATASSSAAEKSEPQKAAPEKSGGFGSFAKMPSSGFGADQRSPFAAAASNPGTTFGQSVLSSGFGGGFGSGSKLKSFAAPIGDAKLGSAHGSVKPIGPLGDEVERKDGSESDIEGEDDQSKDDEISEADDRFQHQAVETGEDGEDTIFSARAKLYAFKDNNWKEAGSGNFKLNVISSDSPEDKEKTGRFIMRAHQTYRVLLNQPIFPKMKVGDRSGNEPTAKAFAFAVIEDGKPVPHMVRVGLSILHSEDIAHANLYLVRGLEREQVALSPGSSVATIFK